MPQHKTNPARVNNDVKKYTPSVTLAGVIGDKPLSRSQASRKIWDYFKKNKSHKARETLADEKLLPLFGRRKISIRDVDRVLGKHLLDDLAIFTSDHVWIAENRSRLLETYADQWIAVKNKKVIASSPDYEHLLRSQSDPSHLCVQFISREPLEMIL
jgi:upstream activation factor subunit UAF30